MARLAGTRDPARAGSSECRALSGDGQIYHATLATYSEVLSRPLFSANRRPSEETPAVMVPMSMTLIAILISPRGAHALVRHGTPPQIDRVAEGQTIDGWTAEAIKFDRVILHRGAEVQELVPVSAEQPRPPPGQPLPYRPQPPRPPP